MSINIVGAGIAGAALAKILKGQGRHAVLFDKAKKPTANAYGITLQTSTYRRFLKAAKLDEASFLKAVAIETFQNARPKDSLRVHRGRLEAYLRDGLDIKWQAELQSIEVSPTTQLLLKFADGDHLDMDYLVAADGEHSDIRKMLTKKSDLVIMPFVAYHGSRIVDKSDFDALYAPAFEQAGTSKLETVVSDSTRLSVEVVVDDTRPTVLLRYTYSRPARGTPGEDRLHRPTRSKVSAKDIPEELFTELEMLPELELPFRDAFDPSRARTDRVLHWLQRKSLLDDSDMSTLAGQRIVMIGQAAHAEPILGGYGANQALDDAVLLSAHIEEYGKDGVGNFYRDNVERWQQAVKQGERRLRDLHAPHHGIHHL